jgi:hypothetical protein
MTIRHLNLLACVASAAAVVFPATAYGEEPSRDELLGQIAELKARVEALEKQQSAVSTRAVDQTVADVMRDAQRRSQLLASDVGAVAGYDAGGFFVRAGDDFVLRPGAQLQFRYVAAWRDDADDDFDSGFEVRRARLTLNGSVFMPDLGYSVSWQTNRNTGSAFLEDAMVTYRFAPRWTIKGGQFKDPVYHEELVADIKQMAVERSMLNELIGGTQTGRVQGVSVAYGDATAPLRAELALHDGVNSLNTPFTDVDADYGVGGRVDYKLAGNWGDYGDFTSFHNKNDLLVIGAGGDFTRADDAEVSRATLDVQWENTSGLGFYAAALGAYSALDAGVEDRFDWGALAQAGQMLGRRWQVFGRYDFVRQDVETAGGKDLFHEVTLGVNYFLGRDGIAGNRAKLTLDALYLPSGAPLDLTGIGVLASDGEAELVLRAQLTLAI